MLLAETQDLQKRFEFVVTRMTLKLLNKRFCLLHFKECTRVCTNPSWDEGCTLDERTSGDIFRKTSFRHHLKMKTFSFFCLLYKKYKIGTVWMKLSFHWTVSLFLAFLSWFMTLWIPPPSYRITIFQFTISFIYSE